MTKAIPDGMHTVTPHLVCAGAAAAIEFYKKAFGATETARIPGPNGKLMHASVRIGDSTVMLVDEMPEHGALGPKSLKGSCVSLHLYVDDADAFAAVGGIRLCRLRGDGRPRFRLGRLLSDAGPTKGEKQKQSDRGTAYGWSRNLDCNARCHARPSNVAAKGCLVVMPRPGTYGCFVTSMGLSGWFERTMLRVQRPEHQAVPLFDLHREKPHAGRCRTRRQ